MVASADTQRPTDGGIFSGQTETVVNVKSVGTTAAELVPGNPNRLALVIINLSANTVYFVPVGIASSTNGIIVSANGGSAGLKRRDDFDLVGYSQSGVASGSSSNVLVLEVNARVSIKNISFI